MKYWPPMPPMPTPTLEELSKMSTEAHADEIISELKYAMEWSNPDVVLLRRYRLREHLDAAEQRGNERARGSLSEK